MPLNVNQNNEAHDLRRSYESTCERKSILPSLSQFSSPANRYHAFQLELHLIVVSTKHLYIHNVVKIQLQFNLKQ